jgi:cytochrome bd-type quinol oxidase subunit 2
MDFPLLVTAVSEGSVLDVAQSYDALEIINRGIAYAIILAGFLSVVFTFFGGISFILSGGQEDKIKQAVSTIRYAIIGLIVTILSVVIVAFVGNALGLNVVEYINLGEVFELISQITSQNSTGGGGGGINSLD